MLDRSIVADAIARLDVPAIEAARWFGAKGRPITAVTLDEGFVLDEAAPHVLAVVTTTVDGRERQRYQVALTGDPLREARPNEGAWRALAAAMAAGRAVPALPVEEGRAPRAALVCRPGPAMVEGIQDAAERDLGADQSHTSVVLGETVLLKAYRRLQPGLNPDLEMTAFLSEEAAFAAVPPLAGFVELIEADGGTTTMAMAQAFVADAQDAFEAVAEALTAWQLAPGEVSLEVATEIASDLGTLTAGLHAAVADGHGLPDMAPRQATRDEVRAWATTAHANLARALDVAPATDDAAATLRALAPRIDEALRVLDAVPTVPEVIRAHGDYHLGQVLVADDGYRIIDFEGEPLSPPQARRAHRHALRDVASMLRSLDHVAGSARRRAERANDGPLARSGLDLPGWRRRARERFLESYREGLAEARVWVDQDPDLLLAFEIDKELYEFAYAATYLPSWLWAPTEGMRGLFEADA